MSGNDDYDDYDVGSPNVARRQIDAAITASDDDEIARVMRISREEYHSTSHETELDQIAEAMRLSIEDEMRKHDSEEQLLKDAIERSMEQVRSADAEVESQIQAAIKESLLEICKSPAIVSKATDSHQQPKSSKYQTELEKDKMRAARLRALEGRSSSKSS